MKIAFAMVTVDRSPRENYVGATLDSLKRSGFREELLLFESGKPRSSDYNAAIRRPWVSLDIPPRPFTSNLNHARALTGAARLGADWVVMMEDDLEFSSAFAESAAQWLADHESAEYRLYAFYASYEQIKDAATRRETMWRYPAKAFYGTQCYALRSADALSAGCYLERPDVQKRWAKNTKGYDLMLSEWHQATFPGHDMLASAPSMVQHIGRSSAIGNDVRFHQAQSYPGVEWQYRVGEGR